MPVSKIRGVDINWRAIGDHGPWVMMTPGGRRGHDELIPLAEKIAARGFRVMLHDRRNTGASDIEISGDDGEEILWTDDMFELMKQQNALPAFFCGSSAGARTSILFYLRHPEAVRGLLLLRVTGGAFAAGRLPENYYGQYIRIAEEGGMAAICATEQYQERIAANPGNRERLMRLDPKDYIAVQKHWRDIFVAGANLPVMGVTEEQLRSIKVPTVIIPGNDNTHASAVGLIAHRFIPGSELHQLPITDQDVPLIPWPDWSMHEPEITDVFTGFMNRVAAADGKGK